MVGREVIGPCSVAATKPEMVEMAFGVKLATAGQTESVSVYHQCSSDDAGVDLLLAKNSPGVCLQHYKEAEATGLEFGDVVGLADDVEPVDTEAPTSKQELELEKPALEGPVLEGLAVEGLAVEVGAKGLDFSLATSFRPVVKLRH